MNPVLVILAAGLAKRFGGGKQVAAVGPHGEWLLEYTLHDALAAGFREARLVVAPGSGAAIGDELRRRLPRGLTLTCIEQPVEEPIPGLRTSGRRKPWGTAHALWCGAAGLDCPCAVANADDCYGPDAFAQAAGLISAGASVGLVAFALGRTLSGHGAVNRGICRLDAGVLRGVDETIGLQRDSHGVVVDARGRSYPADSPVSLNLWVFAPAVLASLDRFITGFCRQHAAEAEAESYLPAWVDSLIREGVRVVCARSAGDFVGMTYREDLELVRAHFAQAIAAGRYPPRLAPA